MKQLYYPLLILICCSLQINAQTSFFDDFESYDAGDFIAASSTQFETWPGAGDDAEISNERSFEGENSLKITGVPAGGPVDVLMSFGQVFDEGEFEFSMQMFVPTGNCTYQNIQAIEPAGQTWAMDMFFNSDGSLFVNQGSNAAGFSFSRTYPQEKWFEFKVVVNLSTNVWQLYVDEELLGFFENQNNSVASLNLYPISQDDSTPLVYIDNIAFEWNEYEIPERDVAVLPTNIKPFYLTSETFDLSSLIKNVGNETIEVMDITYNVNGNEFSETLGGVALDFLDSYIYTPTEEITLQNGENTIIVTVSNPNLQDDMVPSNNTQEYSITAIEPRPHKRVLAEELTGTWCQWCPRGAVFTELAEDKYADEVIVVAVHGGGNDPMSVDEILQNGTQGYSTQVAMFPGVSGYPSMVVDRNATGDPSLIEIMSLPNLSNFAAGRLEITATEDGGNYQFTIHTQALEALNEDMGLALLIYENEVTGTTSDYNQSNAYAGGGSGEMGGYENLPASVPAAQMVYEFVARAYLGEFAGTAGSIIPSPIGDLQTYNFPYSVPADFNVDHMKAVAILFNADGTVNNANDISFADALTNDPVWETISGIGTHVGTNIATEVYPNPSQGSSNVRITLEKESDVHVIVYDILGNEVAVRKYDGLNGESIVPLNASNLPNGQYLVKVVTNEGVGTQKVTIKR